MLRVLLGSERLRYLLVGSYNTVFGFVIFAVGHALVGDFVHYVVILLACNALGIANAYVAHRTLVFRSTGPIVREGTRFATVHLVGLAVNLVALPFLVEVLHVPVVPAQALVVAGTIVATYTAHKRFSFAPAREPASGER